MKDKLKLTDEQKKALQNFKDAYRKLICEGVGLAYRQGRGLFAFNETYIDCFDTPENAAYDNEKIKVSVDELTPFLPYGMANYHIMDDDTCNVVLYEGM